MSGLATGRARLTSTQLVSVVLLATIVVGAVLTATAGRNFFSGGNVSAILTATSILGFVAIGQTLVVLAAASTSRCRTSSA